MQKPLNNAHIFAQGQDAAYLGNPLNPYRRVMASVRDEDSRKKLEEMAKAWEDGFISAKERGLSCEEVSIERQWQRR